MVPEHIFLHHSADSSPDPQFERVNAYHKGQGFPKSNLGFHCGYTYFIGKSGHVKQARSETELGAHTANSGDRYDKTGLRPNQANVYGIGICLAGDFTVEEPTAAALNSLVSLVEEIQARWNIPDNHIWNHRDAKRTTCPGIDLAGYVRGRLIALRSQRVVSPQKRLSQLLGALARAVGPRLEQIQRVIERIKRRIASRDDV
jgi:hypothetical protein